MGSHIGKFRSLREKLVSGVEKSLKNRPVSQEKTGAAIANVEARLRTRGPQVTSERVGLEVLGELRKLDHVAYMRFASVYKDFQGITDFERELGTLSGKREPAQKQGP